MRVLVAEDSAVAPGSLSSDLQRHGHQIQHVSTGAQALRCLRDVDLILLDRQLPDLDGLEVCRSIRARCDLPIIMVTSCPSELDQVLGLQAGSDDYLAWPCGIPELTARMDAVMRRAQRRAVPVRLCRDRIAIDPAIRQVHLDDQPVDVTRKEFDLLYLLIAQSHRVVSRAEIMADVWSVYVADRSRTLDTHVNSLRRKLGARTWINTVRGVGFRLGHG
jgi:DNA-binding response OmpR family regulator